MTVFFSLFSLFAVAIRKGDALVSRYDNFMTDDWNTRTNKASRKHKPYVWPIK